MTELDPILRWFVGIFLVVSYLLIVGLVMALDRSKRRERDLEQALSLARFAAYEEAGLNVRGLGLEPGFVWPERSGGNSVESVLQAASLRLAAYEEIDDVYYEGDSGDEDRS